MYNILLHTTIAIDDISWHLCIYFLSYLNPFLHSVFCTYSTHYNKIYILLLYAIVQRLPTATSNFIVPLLQSPTGKRLNINIPSQSWHRFFNNINFICLQRRWLRSRMNDIIALSEISNYAYIGTLYRTDRFYKFLHKIIYDYLLAI